MREKTPAEKQMEALLKLKQSGGKAVPLPARSQGPEVSAESPWTLRSPKKPGARKRKRKGRQARQLPMSEKSWQALVARFGSDGKLRPSLALGDWAALLASRLPDELKALQDSEWADLIVQLENWCDRRHKKES